MHLTDCVPHRTGILLPTVTQWAADLVEAQIPSGAARDAKRTLAKLEDTGRRTGLRGG